MTTRPDLSSHIRTSHEALRNALRIWEAGNVSQYGRCSEHLEVAVRNLALAQDAVGNSPGTVPPETRQRLLQLRSDSIQMARLVDASAAYCRGLALTVGVVSRESSALPRHEVQA